VYDILKGNCCIDMEFGVGAGCYCALGPIVHQKEYDIFY